MYILLGTQKLAIQRSMPYSEVCFSNLTCTAASYSTHPPEILILHVHSYLHSTLPYSLSQYVLYNATNSYFTVQLHNWVTMFSIYTRVFLSNTSQLTISSQFLSKLYMSHIRILMTIFLFGTSLFTIYIPPPFLFKHVQHSPFLKM
jgi:hypothetical protein